jgi:steroid delta-isomerase-like uncharacterized protein/uncharacterized protein (TIGR02246 family)
MLSLKMRRALFVLATCAAGCATAHEPRSATTSSVSRVGTADPRVETIRGIVRAFNAHDAAAFAALYSPTGTRTFPGSDDAGRSAVQKRMQQFFDKSPDSEFRIGRVWLAGNLAFAEGNTSGTYTGADWGVEARSVPIGTVSMSVYTFDKDGLVQAQDRYADSASQREQMLGRGPRRTPLPTTMEVFAPTGTAEEAQLAELGRRFKSASADGIDAIVALTSPNVDFSTNYLVMNSAKGREGYRAELEKLYAAFSEQSWKVDGSWGVGRYVVIQSTFHAKHTGAFGSIPASGKEVSWPWVDVAEVESGQIRRLWTYTNLLPFMIKIGHVKVGPTGEQKPKAETGSEK